MTDAETEAMVLGIFAVICFAIWRFTVWFHNLPTEPDPWETGDEKVEVDDNAPVCHRCFTPHHPLANFCAECGTAVGEYTNMLPYVNLFSIGDTLRLGTDGQFRRSPLTVTGFLLMGIAEYSIFAPIYWIQFLHTFIHSRRTP